MASQLAERVSEFKTEPTRAKGTRCWFQDLKGKLTESQLFDLLEALNLDSGVQHTAISRVLRRWGHTVQPNQVMRHRNGDCKCTDE